MTRPAPLPDHRAVFPENGTTACSCGKFTGKTYVGWKRHYAAAKRQNTVRLAVGLTGAPDAAYQKLMELGRQVIRAEQLFGEGSSQHKKAVVAWTAQQKKMGV